MDKSKTENVAHAVIKPKEPAPPPQGREPILVKVVRFRRGESVEVPGKPGADYIRTETHGPKSWVVEFLPWMRAFRVAYANESAPQDNRTVYIPESWGVWE